MSEKQTDTEETTTPDLFTPVEQQRVTRYQKELRKHVQGQEQTFKVTTRTSIDTTLQHKAGIEEQRNILKVLIPTVAVIFIVFLTAIQMFIPQYLMPAIFLAPVVTISTLFASTKVNRKSLKSTFIKLKSVRKLKEKLHKPKISPTPTTPISTLTLKKPRNLHIREKLASGTIPIVLLPITIVACVVLYVVQAPYYIIFWSILLVLNYSYVFKVWFPKHIRIKLSVKKHGKHKKTK